MRLFDWPEHNMDKHAELLRREAGHAARGGGFVRRHAGAARARTGTRSGAVQTPPCRMVCKASMMVGTAADLAMNADAPCSERALRDVLVFAAGDHDHRDRGVVRANLHEAGKTMRARHAEVEQQQIDFRMRMQRREQRIDGVGFEGARTGEGLGDGELEALRETAGDRRR